MIGTTSILLVIIFLVVGYFLGKITCNNHFRQSGVWITSILFIVINGLHSFIDGVSLVGTPIFQGIALGFGHELIRQPVLYGIFFIMIAPFSFSRSLKILLAIGAVTGAWALGVILGIITGEGIIASTLLKDYVFYFQFLFIGDMVHHIMDWFHKHD